MTCQAAEGMLAPSNWKNFGTRTTTSAASVSTSSTTSDRKSTRLNSSHSQISYAVFCLKKKKMPNLRAAGSLAIALAVLAQLALPSVLAFVVIHGLLPLISSHFIPLQIAALVADLARQQ